MGVSIIGRTSLEVWKMLGIDIDDDENTIHKNEEDSNNEKICKNKHEIKEKNIDRMERVKRD